MAAEIFVPINICFKHNKNKNLTTLKVYFTLQNLES